MKTLTFALNLSVLVFLSVACGVKNPSAPKKKQEALRVDSLVLADLDEKLKEFRQNYIDIYLSKQDGQIYKFHSWFPVLEPATHEDVSDRVTATWHKASTRIGVEIGSARETHKFYLSMGERLTKTCLNKSMPDLYYLDGILVPASLKLIMQDEELDACTEQLNASKDVAFVHAYARFVEARFHLKVKITEYLLKNRDQSSWLYRERHGPQDGGAKYLPFMKMLTKALNDFESLALEKATIQNNRISYNFTHLMTVVESIQELNGDNKRLKNTADNTDERDMAAEYKSMVESFKTMIANH